MDYPKQEIGTVRGTVSYRDACTVREDSADGGSGQPHYDRVVIQEMLCEVLQVSGGESVRGHTVQSDTSYVIVCDIHQGIHPRCEIEILTGPYAGQRVYIGRIHFETARGRPVNLQLHCGLSDQAPASYDH